MSNPVIPSDINSWSKARITEYYIDELGWTLTPLIEGSKEPKYPKEQQYGVARSDLLLDLCNGCNFGLFPSGTHVILDLDSKSDQGKSVQKFVAQAGPRVQSLPRERTVGGVHIHLRIKDIAAVKSNSPKANKLVNRRVFSKVSGELFFGGTGYVVTSPSLHEAGTRYEWETYGEIPEWSWREFTAAFGDFEPEKSEKPADDATRARKFSGDLKTLDIIKLVTGLGWYHGPDAKRADAHVITCPWSGEHTDGAVTAAVFVGNGQWPGFNCFHAHCCGRRLIDLLDKAEEVKPGLVDSCCTGTWKYEPGAKSAQGCPQVLLPAPGYQLNQTFVKEVADILKDNLIWFSYQHEAVRIGNRQRTWINGQGERVNAEERCLQPITSTEVESLLDAQVATGNINKVELPSGGEVEAFVPCSISPTTAKMLINSPLLIDALPQVDRMVDIPVPINTGSQWVLPRRDYNADTRVFLDQDLKLRQMPLQDAKDLLEDISKDFCFADDDGGQSKCHWYARLVTPMCRGIMGWEARMPLWTFTANRPRAGKDYLNGVAQTLYYGHAFEDSPLERSEETEKRITAALAAGRRSMHIANQQGSYFDDQALIAAITGTVWCSRRLGANDSSSSLEYRNELEFSLSANMGLQFREDFIPRCRFIHLAYFEEDPNSRTFSRPDLHGYVRDNRELMLSAVYSLVVEWKRQGCPNGPTPFTTFPRWGQVVGGVMVACGYGDPCRAPSGASTGRNPREEALSELFETAYEKHQDNWLDAKAVYSLVEDHQFGFWNGLESSKDKEKLAKDLKIYNRRTLRGITLYWQDVTKKLSRTKIRFVKAERASQFVPDVPDENGKNLGDVIGDVAKSPSSEELITETSPTSPNFNTYAYREGNKNKNILYDNIFRRTEVKAGTAGTSGTDKTDPIVEIPELPPFLYVSDVAQLHLAITLLQRNPGDPLCVDIETYGPKDRQWGPASLDPYRGSIRLLSVKSGDSPVYLIDLDRVIFLDDLKQLLESREWVGHNLSFDLGFLRHRFKVKMKSCFDTMVAARILANGALEPSDLGSVLELYLGIKLPKDQGSSDWGITELTAEQLAYAANDVLHLLPLKAEMEKQLEASDLDFTANLENSLVPAVVDINLRGFYVDKGMLEQMLTDAETAKASAEAKLKQALNAPNLNVNSNPQLLNAFTTIGLSLNNTDKKETSRTEYQGHPAVAALIAYRQAKSAYTEKIKSLLAAIRPDGRIHTKYEPLGTGTGRFSCHAPNIQQIPSGRKAPIRKAFTAPEGRKLIKLDYNQMELRACASYTGETRLIKAYKDGADVHRLTASTIFGVPPEQVTDAQRSLGKTINFGFLYGMGAEGFARNLKSKENINLSVEHAKSYRDKFFELYPGLSRWHQDCWRQVRTVPQPKEIRTPGLRRRLIKGGTDFNKFTDLTNTPIQGGCADAMKMAILALEAELPSGTGIVAMLHDELVIETDTSIAEEMLTLAKQKMEEWAGLVFKDVPMLVEGKIVDSWE